MVGVWGFGVFVLQGEDDIKIKTRPRKSAQTRYKQKKYCQPHQFRCRPRPLGLLGVELNVLTRHAKPNRNRAKVKNQRTTTAIIGTQLHP